MKLLDILPRSMVLPEIVATGKIEVINELVSFIGTQRADLDCEAIADTLLERERLGSTGIGEGVAIPHGKLKGLSELVACLGRSPSGVDFQSIDGMPTTLFITLLAPENSAGVHLQALARISRLFKNSDFRHRLMQAEGRDQLFDVLMSEDAKV